MDEINQIPLKDFYKAYYDCRKRKRLTLNALKFEINYSDNLVKLWREVNNMKYKIGPSITFIITRPKDREIFAADFRDRIVHHIVMQRLEPLFEKDFIDDNYSSRVGKGTLYGIERLAEKIKIISNNYKEDCWIGKFDLKGFFMSIHKPTLWIKLKNYIELNYKGPDKKLLLYITKKIVLHSPQNNCIRKSKESMWRRLTNDKSLFTCNPDCGLPIGNLTSQCFANFYLNEFDHLMLNLFNGMYGRYVDDFYIIAKNKEDITNKINYIKGYLKDNLKLTLHPKKIYIQRYDKGVKFIGSVIKKDKINIGSVCLGSLYNAIKFFNKQPVTKENIIKFAQILNSYFGFLSKHDSFYKRKGIWEKIDKKWTKTNIMWTDKRYKKVIINNYYNNIRKAKQEFINNIGNEKYFNPIF